MQHETPNARITPGLLDTLASQETQNLNNPTVGGAPERYNTASFNHNISNMVLNLTNES